MTSSSQARASSARARRSRSACPIPADPHFNGTGAAPTPTPVVSVQLPAGSYWITGKLTAEDTAPAQSYLLDCDVVTGSQVVDTEHGTIVQYGSPRSRFRT